MINNTFLREKVSLKPYNTYRLEGTAKYFIEVKSVLELQNFLKDLKSKNIPFFIIGAGSNIIIDKFFDGAIIKLSGLDKVEINDNIVKAEAGAMMSKLAITSINADLEGLEWTINIPGTVGGSIVGNAGAYNKEMFDDLIKIKVLDENYEVLEINAQDINHSYRHSDLKNKPYIVLEGTFSLTKGNREELLETIADRQARRMASQPLDMPSAGSVFRNPENDYAGRLIEAAGLKGKIIGGAMVSEKHANFIVNKGNATSEDVKNLIKLVHDEVLNKFGVNLELEQQIIEWK